MRTVLDFVEKYYPRYYSCESIARLDDLQKLLDEEFEEGDCAHQILINDFGGNFKRAYPQILVAHSELSEQVYEEAIKGYIKEL